MKIFIFEKVKHLTTNYHPEGGLVVIAENEDKVKELIDNHKEEYEGVIQENDFIINISEEEWRNSYSYDLVDIIKNNIATEQIFYGERLIIFPDAGCC